LNRVAGLAEPAAAGRWWALPAAELEPTKRAVAITESLLDRYPVLTRGSVTAEEVPGGFAGVYRVLAAAEDAGQLRRGYFVEGLGAAQFAQAEVVDRLRGNVLPPGQTPCQAVTLAACDPANPYGAALPWPQSAAHFPGRKPGALVVLVDGALTLYLERGARTLLTWGDDPETLTAATQSLAELTLRRAAGDITIEKVDGHPIMGNAHPAVPALTAAGFKLTHRGYTLRAG
jgi:ATP-dependent Lhr-like helicase